MFEIGVISIVVLAVGYWVTLWLMGRHDDVLHGDFVHTEEGAEAEASALSVPPFPARPPFPVKPPSRPKSSQTKPSPIKPSPIKPPQLKPSPAKLEASTPAPVETLPASPSRTDRLDTLEALLASIKRDLKDASQL
jgi:hypothetical protein